MASRTLLILAALLLGTAVVPAMAQVSTAPLAPNVSLGFDQSSLTPASQGTPLYTQGDQVWVASHYGFKVLVTLSPPSGGKPGAFGTLYPEQPIALYTFAAGDPTGTWTLDLSNSTGFVATMTVTVTSLRGNSSLLFEGAQISLGFLSTTYSLRADGAYDLQACVMGSTIRGLQLDIPQAYGTGLILLNLTGSGYTTTVRGAVFGATEFWFELYHPYSFVASGGNASGLFSRLVQVAASSRQVLGLSAGANVSSGTLAYEAGARQGRYTLQGYFRSAQGIQVVEAQLLLLGDGGWLPLAGCVASSTPTGLTFSLKTPLQAPIGEWPREALVMFRLGGLEGYSSAPVDPGLSAMTLVGTPWNQTMAGVSATASGVGVEGSTTINGTVYVLSTTYPATDSFAISVGTRTFMSVQARLLGPYTHQSLMVPAGKLVVQTTLNGAAVAGVRVSLLEAGNSSFSAVGDASGRAVFYLPSGNFTVVAGNGPTVTGQARVAAGQETDLSLELGNQGYTWEIWLLAGAGVAGFGANAYVWWRWWRGRSVPVPAKTG